MEQYWRVEGELLPPDAVRQVGFFVCNSQGFLERLYCSARFAFLAPVTPLLGAARPVAARRLLHASLRGISRDRLDILGEEYSRTHLLARLRRTLARTLRRRIAEGRRVVLVSAWLDHVVVPLARELGVGRILCNHLEFRNGRATGRLVGPLVPSRGEVGWPLTAATRPAILRRRPRAAALLVDPVARTREPLHVRKVLQGKRILLIGATGFIGKVWMANLLRDLPGIGRVTLLIRPRGPLGARARFERMLADSPILRNLPRPLVESRVRVVEGDMCAAELGLEPQRREELRENLDLIVNAGGVTDFNPDLRTALSTNVNGTLETVRFQLSCRSAALLHLSTCYVAGRGDGRVPEVVFPDFTPAATPGFDAEAEREALRRLVARAEVAAERDPVIAEVRSNGRALSPSQKRKARQRWLRQHLSELGRLRALRYGWPNTYTFSKSLGESSIERLGGHLPIAIVRPCIVETSLRDPFPGWNEGVNTSAPLSHLLGTVFRQFPTRGRKRLDVLPVDLVTRGMTLIAAALLERRHKRCYQLATSAVNPFEVRRAIELTALAHRSHHRAATGFRAWLHTQLETIPVSRRRYLAFSVPRQRALVRLLMKLAPLAASRLRRLERSLGRVEKIIDLYAPFIHDNDHLFAADHIRLLDAALPEADRATFGYCPERIDWQDYWIRIHIPALRKWSYPLIEGRPLEF